MSELVAGSTGRRNTGAKSPCWGLVFQGLTWSFVELPNKPRGVTLVFSRPGKPSDNAFIEAFNSRFRAECLNAHGFMSRADAQKKLEDWRRYYNEGAPTRRNRPEDAD
jgi:transposase InsO family protein